MSCLTGTKGLWHWFSLAVAKCLKLFLLADVQSWLFFSWVVSRALWRLPHWTACPVGKTFASIGWLMLPPTAVGTRWTNPLFGSLHSSKDNSWMKFEMGPGWLSSAEPTWNPWETPSLSLLSVHSTQAAFCLSLSLHLGKAVLGNEKAQLSSSYLRAAQKVVLFITTSGTFVWEKRVDLVSYFHPWLGTFIKQGALCQAFQLPSKPWKNDSYWNLFIHKILYFIIIYIIIINYAVNIMFIYCNYNINMILYFVILSM